MLWIKCNELLIIIIALQAKKDAISVEEQFLNGMYTPNFLKQQDDKSDKNNQSLANPPAARKNINSKFDYRIAP